MKLHTVHCRSVSCRAVCSDFGSRVRNSQQSSI